MSSQELRRLYDHYRQLGVRNVDCGILRGIGKTQCLKQLIAEYRATHQQERIGLLIPTEAMRSGYREIFHILDDVIVCSIMQSYTPREIHFFSDEVPNAEEIAQISGGTLIFGFYSSDDYAQFTQNAEHATEYQSLLGTMKPQFFDISLMIQHKEQIDEHNKFKFIYDKN